MAKKSEKTAKRPSKTAKRTSSAKAKKVKTAQVKSKSKSKPKSKNRPARAAKRIGFLIAATRTDWANYISAFAGELTSRGWIVGSLTGPNNVNIDYEPANGAAGDPALIHHYANQFVQNNVDVIVTAGTEASLACKYATSTIPIVFASVGDPVGSGLVTSLVRPGGNLTGCSNLQTRAGVMNNRITRMRNRLNPTKVGIIGNNNPVIFPINAAIDLAWNALSSAGVAVAPKSLGYFAPSDFQSLQTIRAKLLPLQQDRVDVLLVCSDPLLTANARNLIRAAHSLGMRTMHEIRESHANHGGNQTYGPSFQNLFVKAAEKVDQILRGTPPGSIAIYQPSTFEQDPP
jgi:putative ABC transport system substrate-binding protein